MSDRHPLGLQLSTDQREREYSPSSMLADGDYRPFVDQYRTRSEAARQSQPPLSLTYGPVTANTFDLALPTRSTDFDPAGSNGSQPAPIHVFIHGGYWQELSKADSYFLAPRCTGQGHAFAAVDYTLAPAATVDQIVDECCAAIVNIRSIAPSHGLDPETIIVSGSSAGAHLAAMSTLRLDPDQRPAGLVLVSGIYDLEPLIGTSIDEALGLTPARARAISPLLLPLDGLPPTIVAYGDNETEEFKRQSRALVDRMTDAGATVSEYQVPGRNHFDVVFDIVPDLTEILDGLIT